MFRRSRKIFFLLSLATLSLLQSCTKTPSLIKADKIAISQTSSFAPIEISGWESFASKNGDFRVSFPNEPLETSISNNLATQGHSFFLRGKKFSSTQEDGDFTLEVFDCCKDIHSPAGNYRLILSQNAKDILGYGAYMVKKKHPSIQILSAQGQFHNGSAEFSYNEKEELSVGFMQVLDGKLYILSHSFNANSVEYPRGWKNAQKFWNSFLLTDMKGKLLDIPENQSKQMKMI